MREKLLPFNVNEGEMHTLFVKWLKTGKMIPADLYEKISIVSAEKKYIPFYNYKGEASSSYSASVGYNRTEVYTEWVEKWENGRRHRVPENRTRIVTDWHPYQGMTQAAVNSYGIATDFFENFKIMLLDAQSTMNNIDNKEYFPAQLPGVLIQWLTRGISRAVEYNKGEFSDREILAVSKSADEAYKGLAVNTVTEQISAAARKATPGDQVRIQDISIENMDVETTVFYCPVWFVMYEYEGDKYYVVLNGYEAGFGAGIRPFDNGLQNRIVYARILPMLLAATMSLVGFIIYSADDDFILGLILGIVGAVIFIFCLAAKKLFIRYFTSKNTKRYQRSYDNYLKKPESLFARISCLDKEYIFTKRTYEKTKSFDPARRINDWCAGFDKKAKGKVDVYGRKLVTAKATVLATLTAMGIVLGVVAAIVIVLILVMS